MNVDRESFEPMFPNETSRNSLAQSLNDPPIFATKSVLNKVGFGAKLEPVN
jgi:hypothetical protein